MRLLLVLRKRNNMIKKLLKIKNIGKYDVNSVSDDLSFGKQTIIFGSNKKGKTTLVSILKSLKWSDDSYITGRKTFGTTINDKQECEILIDSNKAIYNTSWTNPNIEIFDNDFIHKNIFVGDKIEQDHKTQLHKILIDESNLNLQKSIDIEEANHTGLVSKKESIKNAIGLNFNEFIKLEDNDEIIDVDKKIKENQNKQVQYHNQTKLNQLKTNTKLQFDFDVFEKDIKQSIDSKLEEKLKEHIHGCWAEDVGEDFEFLNSGIDKISDNKNQCPFCGQGLDDVKDIISNMKDFFGESYKETQMSIKTAITNFKSIDIEKEIAQFKAEGFEFSTEFNSEKFTKDISVILDTLNQKQADLSINTKLGELQEYIYIKGLVKNMNKEVASLEIGTLNLIDLQKEEVSLKVNQERFSIEGKKKYKEYKDVDKAITDKKLEIDQLNQKLKDSLNGLFVSYLDEINVVLKDSGANFKLAELKSISNRARRESFYCDYAFVFDDKHDVGILDTEDKPQFKNTLSDSDKRIFAFAFFIAKLKKDNSLINKIVVLDDPFTSLDEERRDPMISALKNLDSNQIIILSHSRSFVKRCLEKFNKNKEDNGEKIKTLRLNANQLSKTEIAKLDVKNDNDFLDGVIKYLKELQESDELSIGLSYDNIRKIIENIVRVKYGHLLNYDEKNLPMKYFKNQNCKSSMKNKINEDDYQENHHDFENQPTPEELLQKRKVFIDDVLPYI